MKPPAITATLMASILLTACQTTIPPEALKLSSESLQQRQSQSRRFETGNETKLLQAGAQVLQDLGFNIDESETKLGVIVGSKQRDATEAGQIAGAVVMAVLFGAAVPVDDTQTIRASLVTYPVDKSETSLRVTFQRVVVNTQGQVSKIEGLTDPKMYQDFFDKLSQSVFLTANQI